MASNFNDAAVNAVFDRVVSWAMSSGRFDTVNQHEPKSAPANGIALAIWVQSIGPVRSSGLAATSGLLVLDLRVYKPFTSFPYDAIDPEMLSATLDIMGTFSGDFDFDNIAGVRTVDLLGMSGTSLSGQAGYVEVDKKMFRVMTVTLPIIINDVFTQAT